MLKSLKRLSSLVLVFALVVPYFIAPTFANAKDVSTEGKTLADLRKELEELKKQKTETEEKIKLTEDEIKQISNTIASNMNTINQLSEDMITLQEEISQAEKDIEEKDKEIKEILNFLQVSSGESAYLEYAFGAKDFTDFIYRMAVSEQLSSYNEALVDEYNSLIESNKKKKAEKEKKQEELRKKQQELAAEKEKLGQELKTDSDISLDVDGQIESYENSIAKYTSSEYNCGENELLSKCFERRNVLPPGTAFYRPIVSGRVTSEFGSRCYWLSGKYKCDLHGAIDLAQSGTVPVYAAAPGIVIGHGDRWSCGGNMVFIIHDINGKKYTSLYGHLRSISVRDGQVVSLDTQIGIMGGNPATEWWDGCSTGQHVHFGLANGHYLKDYYSWSTFEANMFNPRVLLNVPATGGRFNGRYTKY